MIALADIQAARKSIGDSVFLSPCAYSETFSRLTGNKIFFKLENLQMTGSFKERGAVNKLLSLTPEERQRGVITASAGNHAQGVAYHATRLGIRSKICMPVGTPLIKVSSTRSYGAEVILFGNNFDEACEEAERIKKAENLTFVHPFDDDAIIAGQGTIGLELLEQQPDLEAAVVPIGGGGLIGGIACALKETNPKIRIEIVFEDFIIA
jgi:threonine dehydratase